MSTQPGRTRYGLEFYVDAEGGSPVRDWLRGLSAAKRHAAGAGLDVILGELGPAIAGTKYGKQLGRGLLEFRLAQTAEDVLGSAGRRARPIQADRGERILLRVFLHCHGDRVVLLLGGYDKGADPKGRRQQAEIETARARLADWQRRQRLG
jgi:hypothetical protein